MKFKGSSAHGHTLRLLWVKAFGSCLEEKHFDVGWSNFFWSLSAPPYNCFVSPSTMSRERRCVCVWVPSSISYYPSLSCSERLENSYPPSYPKRNLTNSMIGFILSSWMMSLLLWPVNLMMIFLLETLLSFLPRFTELWSLIFLTWFCTIVCGPSITLLFQFLYYRGFVESIVLEGTSWIPVWREQLWSLQGSMGPSHATVASLAVLYK